MRKNSRYEVVVMHEIKGHSVRFHVWDNYKKLSVKKFRKEPDAMRYAEYRNKWWSLNPFSSLIDFIHDKKSKQKAGE